MEWQLTYDNDQLQALGITTNDIRNAISTYYNSDFLGMAQTEEADKAQSWMRIMLELKPSK